MNHPCELFLMKWKRWVVETSFTYSRKIKCPLISQKQNFPRLDLVLPQAKLRSQGEIILIQDSCIPPHFYLSLLLGWSSNFSISTLQMVFICLSQVVHIFSSFQKRCAQLEINCTCLPTKGETTWVFQVTPKGI